MRKEQKRGNSRCKNERRGQDEKERIEGIEKRKKLAGGTGALPRLTFNSLFTQYNCIECHRVHE